MIKEIDDIEREIVLRFLETEFPIKRLKFKPKTRAFKKGIVIPHTLGEGNLMKYPLNEKYDREILFMIIHKIIKNVFMCIDPKDLSTIICEYLDIT